ncbi:Hypothetical protein NTJ_00295 [Nesidiocoris tenuis]|uniref:Uncharacterized protein n=1 Tax=Nesidiocoris tenuis TaxID=355587 RepID=A0ABN7A5K9_9HEMI|nr:Hypothetical protein NTJ_00295 [Nesidiocoris tenuis]
MIKLLLHQHRTPNTALGEPDRIDDYPISVDDSKVLTPFCNPPVLNVANEIRGTGIFMLSRNWLNCQGKKEEEEEGIFITCSLPTGAHPSGNPGSSTEVHELV